MLIWGKMKYQRRNRIKVHNHVLNHKRGSDSRCRHYLKFGIYFILTLGLFNNNLSWKGKMSVYWLELNDEDVQISGNLLFALLDFEFCFLLLEDPNIDFDSLIPEGCGFPILPYFLIFLDSDNFEFCTFFWGKESAFVLVLIMFLGSAAEVGLGDTSLLFEAIYGTLRKCTHGIISRVQPIQNMHQWKFLTYMSLFKVGGQMIDVIATICAKHWSIFISQLIEHFFNSKAYRLFCLK